MQPGCSGGRGGLLGDSGGAPWTRGSSGSTRAIDAHQEVHGADRKRQAGPHAVSTGDSAAH
eukprot:6944080-Pyramimonas_sp.AAC.1